MGRDVGAQERALESVAAVAAGPVGEIASAQGSLRMQAGRAMCFSARILNGVRVRQRTLGP